MNGMLYMKRVVAKDS